MRKNEHAEAALHLGAVRGELDIGLRVELALVRSYLASKVAPEASARLLDEAAAALGAMPRGDEYACLLARLTDQRAHAQNSDGDHGEAEGLYRALPAEGAPPFALCRRANGLAYARWKQGHMAEAAALAREAARHAGDGGHVRLRVMALAMLARIDPREQEAHVRALEIAARLEDELLLHRLTVSRG